MKKAEVKVFTGGPAQTNGYLLLSDEGSILVDAPLGFLEWLRGEIPGLKVVALLLTHQHFDHVQGAAEIIEHYKCPVYAFSAFSDELTLAREARQSWGLPIEIDPFVVTNLLSDEENFSLAGFELVAKFVPGHAPDSLCFYIEAQDVLFSGDTIFSGSIGRTDLPRGSHNDLISSIQKKLLVLPKETILFSGHGPGTTLAEELDQNPYLI